MNKKADMWEDLSDVFLGGLILFVGISSYFLITGFHERSVETVFEEKLERIDDDEFFISYLNAKVDDESTYGDLLIEAHVNDAPGGFITAFDSFLENVYSRKVCWEMHHNNQSWFRRNDCDKEEDIIDSTLKIPHPDQSYFTARLMIKGYVQ